VKERKQLIDLSSPLSVRKQCDLFSIDRSSIYRKPTGESEQNLSLMKIIDKLFLKDPTLGVLGMTDALRDILLFVNVKRVRRLMRKMCIEPIYPKQNLSKLGLAKYIRPYLLRHLDINRPNQVWQIDITYIPMKNGFLYLTAIIDVYSRYIVGWGVANTLAKETQTDVLEKAINQYGKPEIINSDQGAQYTAEHWISTLEQHDIKVSMNGKGRATDNIFIERFFGTLKRKHIYLNPAENGLELYKGVQKFIKEYNQKRHQGINRQKPSELYAMQIENKLKIA
jgi:putative transposase